MENKGNYNNKIQITKYQYLILKFLSHSFSFSIAAMS